MKVRIKLFAHLRDGRFTEKELVLEPGATVQDIAVSLGIDQDEVGVTMLNFCHCDLSQDVHEGDTVAIFPMIGGG